MEQNSLYDDKKGSSGVGCLRGALVVIMAPAIAAFVGLWLGKHFGWFDGVMSGIGAFFAMCFLAWLATRVKARITVFDCFSPALISFVPAILFYPIHLAEADFFSPFTCIASGILLTWALHLYRVRRLPNWALILPALIFGYECLPVDLPVVGNLLEIGGDVASAIWIVCFKLSQPPPTRMLDE